MATAARGWQGFRTYLEMIKIEHSVFALPFALLGMVWASRYEGGSGWPGWSTFGLIVLAMVSCRSAAMAWNRIADRNIDAENPRTRMRAIPAGLLSLRTANLYFYGSCLVFFLAAALLNPLAFALSPVALGVTLFYSLTKRFTWLCHFVLGLSLGIAPAAAWIATTGKLALPILPVTAAVLFWTAGFDIIYSLQDENFDKSMHLRSLPETFGTARSLAVSRVCHTLAIGFLLWACILTGAGTGMYVGVGLAAVLLAYEQSLVRPSDLSKVNLAFFTLNGFVSIGVFLFALIDLAVRHR
ncbi:MAG: UbiA family prenyltransferase [Armatimonadetes bacterium]|nr:UbiA family prenyltransferase [Armatimonadota bacterium]